MRKIVIVLVVLAAVASCAASPTMLAAQTYKREAVRSLVLAGGGNDPTKTLTLKVSAMPLGSIMLTLPNQNASGVLLNDGSGSLSWLSVGGFLTNPMTSPGDMIYGGLLGAPSRLAATSTGSQILLSGASAAPSWSTATYPATTTANQLLYSNAANAVTGLATAANGVLVTSGTGAPSISSTLPAIVQGNITSVGTIGSGVWNGSAIGIAYGGTGGIAGAWGLSGNTGIASGSFLGTTDANDLVFKTVGATAMTIGGASNAGNVGIGTAPTANSLAVNGNIQMTSATNDKITTNNSDLVFEQTGDTYGTTRLHIQNRNGSNCALFEQAGTVNLADFGFKPGASGVQSNIRLEDRNSEIRNTANDGVGEFQFYMNTTVTPVYNFSTGEAATTIEVGNVGIGMVNPTQKLQLQNGNLFLSNNNATADELQLQGTSTGLTTFEAGAQGSTNINYILPTAAPTTSGQVLSSTTGGTMSWVNGQSSTPTPQTASYTGGTIANTSDNSYQHLTNGPSVSLSLTSGERILVVVTAAISETASAANWGYVSWDGGGSSAADVNAVYTKNFGAGDSQTQQASTMTYATVTSSGTLTFTTDFKSSDHTNVSFSNITLTVIPLN